MKHPMVRIILNGVLDDDVFFSMADLCRACSLNAEYIIKLIDYGVIEPMGKDIQSWRFDAVSLRRVRTARRLEKELGLNFSGLALALELLEEIESLRIRLRRLKSMHK